MTKQYDIEYMYRVTDCISGGVVLIQKEGDGTYLMDGTCFTVAQIPGIIEVLQKLEKEFLSKNDIGQTIGSRPEALAKEREKLAKKDGWLFQSQCNSVKSPPF